MAELVKVATVGQIAPGEALAVEAGGRRIALFSTSTDRFMRLTTPVPTKVGLSPREWLWAQK